MATDRSGGTVRKAQYITTIWIAALICTTPCVLCYPRLFRGQGYRLLVYTNTPADLCLPAAGTPFVNSGIHAQPFLFVMTVGRSPQAWLYLHLLFDFRLGTCCSERRPAHPSSPHRGGCHQPKDKGLPRDDFAERKQRLRDWENAPTKEYKVIVLDGDNKKVKKVRWRDGDVFRPLSDLNERPLKFLTDFRPRARYVWWTFMNAILQATWRKKENGGDILQQEVAKATRHWGSPGSYVKKSLLRGIADEICQDIESILDISINDDTGDTGDLYHETVVSILEENVFQAKKAAKKVEDESEDEDNEDEWTWTEEDYIWGRG
jgi:hypothetical protein